LQEKKERRNGMAENNIVEVGKKTERNIAQEESFLKRKERNGLKLQRKEERKDKEVQMKMSMQRMENNIKKEEKYSTVYS
jgi:hypothetical protein